MICYIKSYKTLKGVPYINKEINIHNEVNINTGEINETKNYSKYKNIKIRTLYKKRDNNINIPNLLEISGSLHYLSNNGNHNHNFFDYASLVSTIDKLSEVLQIEPENLPLVNLEFGINAILNQNVDDLLLNLLMHQTEPFTLVNERGFRYKQCKHAQYIVKAYNKGKQFNLPHNVLRFEIKYLKSHLFNEFGIYTLNDLKDISKLEYLFKDLLKKWDECILYQEPLKIQNTHTIWSEQNYWMRIKTEYSRNYFSRERNKFNTYIDTQTTNIKGSIRQEFLSQWCKFTTFQNQTTEPEKVQIYTLNIVSNCTPLNEDDRPLNKPTCLITGEDISDQKKGSKFKSAKKIGEKEAHKLRNQHSNPRNNLKRKLNKIKEQNSLFHYSEVLKLSEDQKAILNYWNRSEPIYKGLP